MIKALLIKGANESLQYLDNDISLIKKGFLELGFFVDNVEGEKFKILSKVCNIIDEMRSTDTLIVYYTGHGVLKQGGVEFKVASENKVTDFLSFNELIENTSNVKSNKVVFILDCCYAGVVNKFWKDYADENHLLFLPSTKLESVEELEEFQASLFTYCISKALDTKPKALYDEEGRITLQTLYNAVRENVLNYIKVRSTNAPIPELFGRISKEVVLRNKIIGENGERIDESIKNYIEDFMFCIEKCNKSCYDDQHWCTSIFKSDAKIYNYVIPSIREFVTNPTIANISKLDAFFDDWFIDEKKYLVLLGDMGVGKTTACMYMFYYLAKKYQKKEYDYVPVYFSLTELNEEIEKNGIYDTIRLFMNDKLLLQDIKTLSSQHRMVFILDGFDEISGDCGISTIFHNYNRLKPFFRVNCKTVLTCRTHYFSEQNQLEEVLMGKNQGTDFAAALLYDEYPFNIVELQEFTEEEILELIKLLAPNENNNKIWSEIGQVYDLKDLAKRAILLKMIVQTLPELHKNENKINSTILYLVYTQKLLRREIESRKIGIELSEKENFIGYIAYLMFANDEFVINTHKFDKEIKGYFNKSLYSMDKLNNYNYDCKVSTFFSRDRQDNYRFMHKSFYEFYFALYCVRQMGEDNLDPWGKRWFPREIAFFITELLSDRKYKHLISKLINISLETEEETVIWNTLHIVSLLDKELIRKYLSSDIKQEYVKRGNNENRCVIIRQYCRIIAKFIDRKVAEDLIDKMISIVRENDIENLDNDETYYNYYGGKNAAIQAFIKHLSVNHPKYDAKLHLYLLEHLATKEYANLVLEITSKWEEKDCYLEAIEKAVRGMNTAVL